VIPDTPGFHLLFITPGFLAKTKKEVTWGQEPAGGDVGRFIAGLQKPDAGWGKGKQMITISCGGTTAGVHFAIDDTLQTTPLRYTPPVLTAGTTPKIHT
jgi:hypothetical protein